MPPRKNTTKKADPTPEETEMAENVENAEETENTEEITEENNSDEMEENEPTPLEIELSKIPETDDDLANAWMKRIAEEVVQADEYNDIILRNSLDDAGIQNFAETSDIQEIVNGRDDWYKTQDEIADLEERLEKLNEREKEQKNALFAVAKVEMEKGINLTEKEGARSGKTRVSQKYKTFVNSLRELIDTSLDGENPKVGEWLGSHTSRVYGGINQGSGNGNVNRNGGSSTRDRERSARIREWATQNGYSLKDRGRVPQHIVDAYDRANPNG